MRRLSTGEIHELTGVPMNTIDKWVRAGLIEPVGPSGGRGDHRRFSMAQAVALAFVAEWRAWGAGRPLLAPLLRHLSAMTDEQMLAAFAEGRTHLMTLPDGDLEVPPPPDAITAPGFEMTRFDLQRVYRGLRERAAAMERRAGSSIGPNRRLAAGRN